MTAVRRALRFVRRHRLLVAPAGLALIVLSALGVHRFVLEPELTGIPFPIPFYDIEAVSGTHTASLLNLPIGQPGLFVAPMPVDVDGDLIPDVLVSVNLVDVAEVFNNPPELGKVIAPNVVIERFVKGVPLGKSPPLKINVKLRIRDIGSGGPDTYLRLGYDTGTAGSIPGSWKAVARGIETLFNPMQLAVDTKGGVVNSADSPFIYYEGPLNLIAGIEKGDFKVDADLGYAPFPDSVRVNYASDDAGQHFEYAHGTGNDVHLTYGTDVNGSNVKYIPGDLPEVDLTTKVAIRDGAETTDVLAAVDRLPRKLAFDLGTGGSHAGSADYRASTDGRPPDARLRVRTTEPGERPLNASLTLDGIPSTLHADWSLPEDGPAAATFDASGAGLGAVEADIRNYDGESATIAPYASPEQQFLSLQQVGGDPAGPDRWITGRVERIRHFQFAQTANDGLEVDANVGDGEQPMLAHYLTDDRSGGEGSVLEGTATIAPMPDTAHVSVVKPAANTDDPLIVKYTASEAVDVDGRVEMRDAGAGPDCGDHGTLCASLAARHMPSEVTTTVRNLEHQTHIDIDSTLRGGGAQPDFFVDAQMGQDDDVPLIAHAAVLGAPRYVRIFTHEGADQTLDRAEFHSCKFDYTANACESGSDGPADEVGALELSIKNWFERPVDLPAHTSTTPSYFDIVARGGADPHDVRFEAVGRVTNIREVDYRNVNGVAGVRTHVGGGNAFSAHADFGNVAFTPDDPVATMHRYDVLADVLVPALPSELDVCFRQAGTAIRTPSDTFVAPCEVANPFDDPPTPPNAAPPTAPLTFAYAANATFDVKTTGRVVDRGIGATNVAVADDSVIAATTNVYDLPRELTLNVDAPPQGIDGPIRVLFDGDVAEGDPQVSIDLDARQTNGDLVCADPRVPAAGDHAMCVRAGLRNLPETALVTYDPTKPADNLHVLTTGDQVMNIVGFGNEPEAELSIVKRHEPTITTKGGTGIKNPLPGIKLRGASADVLIARGRILGLPREVTGTLRLPSAVEIHAEPRLGTVDLTIQNFIAPDPMPSSLPGPRSGVPDADQKVTYLQRGDHFRADIEVSALRGASFASAVDSTGKELDTKTMSVDFGPDHTVRAYADLLTVDEASPTDALKQVIADVTLPDMPEGMSLCFRGPKAANAPTPVQPTYCDSSAVAPADGAFSVATDPGADANELDVHAFVRVAGDGGAEVTAARLDVTNVPRVLQGTFNENGKITVGGFSNANAEGIGQDPDGIDQITFDFADFDAAGLSGFAADPWEFGHASDIVAFPPAPAGQNLRLRVTDTAVRAAGTIGDVGATGNLQALLVDKVVCPAPPNAPADYATYYNDAVTDADYTCIRAVFDPGGTPSPVHADVVVEKDQKRIAFHDGGFSQIPDWVQLTMASTEPTRAGDPFTAPCGPAYVPSNTANCLPPMIRLDTKSDATLAGVLELGATNDLRALDGMSPNGSMVDLKAVPPLVLPGPNAWSNWVSPSNPGAHGARLRMATFKTPGDDASRIAVRAGLRLAVPKSFTLDQVQTWDAAGPEAVTEDRGDEAKDIKLHYTVRNAAGAVQSTIGEAAAMITLDGGKQILLGGEDSSNIQGFDIPGDVALDVYLRHHKRPDKNEDPDPKDRLFAQIDGRVNSPITAHLRVSGDGMRINALVKNVPALPAFQPGDANNDPSFRLRFEMDDDREKSSIPDDGFLCLFLCIKKDVAVETIDAVFDFANNGHPDDARRVDAFVDLAAPRIALDVRAFRNIDPAVNPTDDVPAEISGKASAHLMPLDVFIHAEFLVAGANVGLISDLRAGADIVRANRFRVTSNLLHLKTQAQGSGTSTISTQFSPQLLAGELHSPFGIFLGDPILYWFLFAPPVPPDSPHPLAANIRFSDCPIPEIPHYLNEVSVPGGAGEQNLYAWLDNDFEPRFNDGGSLKKFFFDKIIGPAFCLTDADLITGSPKAPFLITSHPVPPVAQPPAQVPNPPVDPPPPPPLTVAVDRAMCGEQRFSTVTIDAGATLQVANAAGPDCAAADVGTLRLKATGAATINGTLQAATGSAGDVVVSADSIHVTSSGRVFGTQGPVSLLAVGDLDIDSGAAVNAAATSAGTVGGSAATGANGAGHGGAGGLSGPASLDPPPPSFGTPGTAYGDSSLERIDGFVPAEAGSAAVAAGRRGGGVVELVGDHVRIAGIVTVAASPPAFTVPNVGDCAVEGDGGKPNTGSVGTGGGSGGTVVLAGYIVDLTGGQVLANGGQGGAGTAGGGGGGGGGVAKVITPVLLGAPNVAGGGGGANSCAGDVGIAAGTAGANGTLIRDAEPVSHVLPSDRLWWGNGFDVDVQAAGQTTPEQPSINVTLCGTWRPPQTADEADEDLYDLDMPLTNGPGNPCGSGDFSAFAEDSVVQELTHKFFAGPEGVVTLSPPSMTEGYWGLYSIATSCTGTFPSVSCTVQSLPEQPDRIVGIDNTKPALTIALPGVEGERTKNQVVTLDIDAPTDTMSRYQAFSGLFGPEVRTIGGERVSVSGTDQIECSNDAVTWVPCAPGPQPWQLSAGSGPKIVYVQAFDRAGNANVGGVQVVHVELDNTPPSTLARFEDGVGPDGLNGWFISSPSFELYGYDDHGAPEPETGKTRFRWWIDSGSATEGTVGICSFDCVVHTDLSDGEHTFNWQGVDALENEETPHTIKFRIDRNYPRSALLSSPRTPDGANGWYVSNPWIVVSAVDPPGGSGLVNQALDPTRTAGIYYQVKTEGQPDGPIHGPIAPRDFVPFQLGQGSHDVCWQVVDRAGKKDHLVFGFQCQHYDVDLADPTTIVTPIGTPGDNGWFTSILSVGAVGFDTGSGVDQSFDPLIIDRCTPPADDDDTISSGVCVSVDSGSYLDRLGNPDLIGEGLHTVRAYTTDFSGRRSRLVELPLQVDRSHPVSSIRTMPAAPAVNGWWRTSPTVVLRAGDGTQNAGVSALRYRVDGGAWTDYLAPFKIPEGLHSVDYQSFDRSGAVNGEAPRTLPLRVDVTSPVAKALSPSPLIWSKLLGNLGFLPAKAKLNFQVSDNLSHKVHVYVIVYDTLGAAARRIDGGIRDVTPGVTYNGFVEWDGRDQSLTGFVGIGLYHYRVIAIDEAGNRTQTGESKPIQIKVL